VTLRNRRLEIAMGDELAVLAARDFALVLDLVAHAC
jgi:hypothetical protein